MTEATARPWQISSLGASFIEKEGGPLIASTIDVPGKPYKANAEFIVRACNSHDKLVEALADVAPRFHAMADKLSEGGRHAHKFEDCNSERCRNYRAALEEAKA